MSENTFAKFRYELSLLPKLQINSYTIPNVIHFVWVQGWRRDYSFVQYLTIKAAVKMQNPDKIYIYNNEEPVNNKWWDKSKAIQCVEIIYVTAPRHINGKYIEWEQHVADLMRLCILFERGGIYLDFDLLLIRPVDELLKLLDDYNSILMCRESDEKIWNGFIAVNSHNKFLQKWIREYETKYGTNDGGCWWAGLSVETPMRICNENNNYKECVILLEREIFLPFYHFDNILYTDNEKLKALETGENALKNSENAVQLFPKSYGVHLWETETDKRNVLPLSENYFTERPVTPFTALFSGYF
jgi:glycosyl transferase-like sugar-binding protein/alpha 1,4-glycosyltransferase